MLMRWAKVRWVLFDLRETDPNKLLPGPERDTLPQGWKELFEIRTGEENVCGEPPTKMPWHSSSSAPGRWEKIGVDGNFGPESTRALQSFLKHEGERPGPIDGKFGPESKRALQSFLKKRGQFASLRNPIDANFGKVSIRGLQAFLRDNGHPCGAFGAAGDGVDGSWGGQTTRSLQSLLNEASTGTVDWTPESSNDSGAGLELIGMRSKLPPFLIPRDLGALIDELGPASFGEVDLSGWNFVGPPIAEVMQLIKPCARTLKKLVLRDCQVKGKLPDDAVWSEFVALNHLDLRGTEFTTTAEGGALSQMTQWATGGTGASKF